jgi:hypothetical protein
LTVFPFTLKKLFVGLLAMESTVMRAIHEEEAVAAWTYLSSVRASYPSYLVLITNKGSCKDIILAKEMRGYLANYFSPSSRP